MSSNTHARPAVRTPEAERALPLSEDVQGILDEARDRFTEVRETITNLMTTRPALALGLALATGVIVGWLIKRR